MLKTIIGWFYPLEVRECDIEVWPPCIGEYWLETAQEKSLTLLALALFFFAGAIVTLYFFGKTVALIPIFIGAYFFFSDIVEVYMYKRAEREE